jgi:hypothetical protein
MNNLGSTLRDLGDLDSARELLEQTLAARQRVLGSDHQSTLMAMNSLALTRRAFGDLQGARDLFEKPLLPADGCSATIIGGACTR